MFELIDAFDEFDFSRKIKKRLKCVCYKFDSYIEIKNFMPNG